MTQTRLPALIVVTLAVIGFSVASPTAADEMIGPTSKPAVAARPLPTRAFATRSPRAATAAPDAQGTEQIWLYDFLERLLDPAPAKSVQRKPRMLSARVSRPAAVVVALVDDRQLAERNRAPTVAKAGVPQPSLALPAASPIITGALPVPAQLAVPLALQGEELVMAAERAQAAQDLVKLELALRSYDELRQSGQSVFETRPDWRVLERASDALTGAEQAAAHAVGFEANAYINETQKTIVIGIAGTKDLRRHLIAADIWQALIKSEQPQHFFMAKSYARSVITRYQLQGFQTECVGHSLGGGACAYLAGELGIRALVVNPITAGKPAPGSRFLVTNYVVDGDIANLVYGARGNEFGGEIQWISVGRAAARAKVIEKFGPLAGPVLVVKNMRDGIDAHKLTRALDLIAVHAGVERVK
jgi:hypothetical protein